MGYERGDVAVAQVLSELLALGAGVAEHQTLLPSVQCGDHGRSALNGADIVQGHLGRRRVNHPLPINGDTRGDDLGSDRRGSPGQPSQQLIGVPDRG